MPKASTTTGTQKWLSVRMALSVDRFNVVLLLAALHVRRPAKTAG
jgi:hypothetical protein